MQALIIGCGPGGERWREVMESLDDPLVIATNSSIVDAADHADWFVCVENLGLQPEVDHPWITTKTAAHRIINSKTWNRMRVHKNSDTPYDRPETPIIYPKSSVGTVLYYILQMLTSDIGTEPYWLSRIDEVHLVGFPLCFLDDVQHWTEAHKPYTVNASYYMPPEVFVTVNSIATLWQFAMAAAYVRSIKWPFEIINHGGGLLDIPGIERMWDLHDLPPHATDYLIGE